MRFDDPYEDAKKSRWLQVAFIFALAALVVLLLTMCYGCYPEFVKEYAACGRTLGGMIERRDDVPEDLKAKGAAFRRTSEDVQRQVGLPQVPVDEDNFDERVKETGEHAKEYVPLFRQLIGASTGSDWLDIIIALVLGGGVSYTGGHTIRKKLFKPKEGK